MDTTLTLRDIATRNGINLGNRCLDMTTKEKARFMAVNFSAEMAPVDRAAVRRLAGL